MAGGGVGEATGVAVGGTEVGSGVGVGSESPCDSTGVGVSVGGSGVNVAVGEGVKVGVGVLKRTSLGRVGSGLGFDWVEKLLQARMGINKIRNPSPGVQSLLWFLIFYHSRSG